ncbi:MAG TPA: hypothetical protein VKV04_00185 [Verrucomicrobiae bacterium]|nr:hypothetical protein [Verrucomicrobiae bacterium]
MRYAFIKLSLAIVCVSLLAGCAVWTGGVPSSYRQNGNYPVVASIHGIQDVTHSDDLSKTIISYTPTNEMVLNTNTIHGWIIQIPPAQKRLFGQEFYVLPKAARWDTSKVRVVSIDQTTCLTEFFVPKGAKYISDDWGMFPDDPIGEYEIAVFLDRKLAADFKFRVVERQGDRAAKTPPNTALEPSAAAPSVSDVPDNPKSGDKSTSASGGGGSALDR